TRFCERCGTPVDSESVSPGNPPSRPSSQPGLRHRRSRGPLVSVVAIALIALFAATSWWILRTPLQPEATAQRPRPEGVSERSNPVPPGFDRADEPASTQSEHYSGADPAALFDERGLDDWVARQDWFVALQQSLPQGVRASFHVFEGEGEDSGW